LKMRDRTTTVNAAVMDKCPASNTLPLIVPVFEQRYPDLPHWLRRQLASLHAPNMTFINQILDTYPAATAGGGGKKSNRTVEELFNTVQVPCIAANQLTAKWPSSSSSSSLAAAAAATGQARPHFLMIDAEGADADIALALIGRRVPSHLLPLALHVEIKTLGAPLLAALKKALTVRGYHYSAFHDAAGKVEGDVFAVLMRGGGGGGSGRPNARQQWQRTSRQRPQAAGRAAAEAGAGAGAASRASSSSPPAST